MLRETMIKLFFLSYSKKWKQSESSGEKRTDKDICGKPKATADEKATRWLSASVILERVGR